MKDVVGSNMSEQSVIVAIQKALGIYANGWIGMQTLTAIAQALGAECWPATVQLYGMPCIIARDIVVCNPKASVRNYKNSISGSFCDNIKEPVSVMVNDGIAVRGHACHFWEGFPESVLYKTADGKIGIKRVKTINELPKLKWAVGGMGLLANYDPAAEGFIGKFSDVLRDTDHTVLGEKNGFMYLLYCKSMTAKEINAFCKDKLMLDKAILLDGGHVAAINGEESFARINTAQRQLYLIQGV